jgi:hypothetical protein
MTTTAATTTTALKLIYTCDPAHGWLHVKRSLAHLIMGEAFDRITSFSYQRGGTIYLEEDQDAHLFLECAKTAGIKVDPDIRHIDRYSPIRSYDSFSPS